MTPERERLVRAVEEAQSNLNRLDAMPDNFGAVRSACDRVARAQDTLAAYDAAHPEEAK